MKAIRIFFRNIRDGFKSVGRNFSLSLASISCITITLLVVAVALIVASNIENMTKLVKEDFTIVSFINVDAKEEDINKLKEEINAFGNIESIEHHENIATPYYHSLCSIINTPYCNLFIVRQYSR